jgi:hypothetical protein
MSIDDDVCRYVVLVGYFWETALIVVPGVDVTMCFGELKLVVKGVSFVKGRYRLPSLLVVEDHVDM